MGRNRPTVAAICRKGDMGARLTASARRRAPGPRPSDLEWRGFLSYSSFGHPYGEQPLRGRKAVELMDQRGADFEYEGVSHISSTLRPVSRSSLRLDGTRFR